MLLPDTWSCIKTALHYQWKSFVVLLVLLALGFYIC